MEIQKERKLQPYQSFLLITVVFIIFLGVQVAGVPFLGNNLYLYQAISEILGLAIPVLAFLLITRRVKENIHIRSVSIKNVLIISAIITLFIPVSMLLATFNMWVVESTVGLTAGLEDMFVLDNFSDYIKSVLVMALVPAVCEEIAFRTAFMSGLERLGKVICFVFVSLFFSLAHMIPEKLFSTFALSILLCYFLYRTGSVIASAVGHFINNFIALTITFLASGVVEQSANEELLKQFGVSEYGLSFIFWGVLSVLVTPVIIILLKRFRDNTEHTKITITKQMKLDGSGLAAFLPALVVFLLMLALVIVGNVLTNI